MEDLYLMHHGVKGQKWGVRRYQNTDGTRTAEGKKRISKTSTKAKVIKAAKIGGTVAGTALAAYGTYKLGKSGKLNQLAKVGKSVLEKSKEPIKNTAKNAGKRFVEGIPQGIGDATNKLGKAVGFTITALTAKKLMDMVLGEDTYKVVSRTYNANHKKDKINFEKPKIERKEDEDDDD